MFGRAEIQYVAIGVYETEVAYSALSDASVSRVRMPMLKAEAAIA